MNRNSFSGIRALNVFVFIFFAGLVIPAAFGTGLLIDKLLGGEAGLGSLVMGLAGSYYGVRQAWFTAFGDKKFGLRA